MHRIFILSPASTSGRRASFLMRDRAEFELARHLRTGVATLGEVFSFLSGLYFRGKYAYSQFFGRPPAGLPAEYVITSSAGLVRASERISLAHLHAFGKVAIDLAEPLFEAPFRASARELKEQLSEQTEIVLLGSIATDKYTKVLEEVFGRNLLFPKEFVGRGDMSRGGLMLRAVEAQEELEYVALADVVSRRGSRPPKLPPPCKPAKRKAQTSPHEDKPFVPEALP